MSLYICIEIRNKILLKIEKKNEIEIRNKLSYKRNTTFKFGTKLFNKLIVILSVQIVLIVLI